MISLARLFVHKLLSWNDTDLDCCESQPQLRHAFARSLACLPGHLDDTGGVGKMRPGWGQGRRRGAVGEVEWMVTFKRWSAEIVFGSAMGVLAIRCYVRQLCNVCMEHPMGRGKKSNPSVAKYSKNTPPSMLSISFGILLADFCIRFHLWVLDTL